MKTSHILIALITIITLTGMVATDVLLKQEYDKIDWNNKYQSYERRALPAARHWVITGTPNAEIIIERTAGKSQALIDPDAMKFYRTRQQDDTVWVSYSPDFSGYKRDPRDDAGYEMPASVVLRLPELYSLRAIDSRVTIKDFTTARLAVSLQNSRLRTTGLTVREAFTLTARQQSFAVLGADRYTSLRAVVQDSSGVQLNDSRVQTFTSDVAPRAEVQLKGQALGWLK